MAGAPSTASLVPYEQEFVLLPNGVKIQVNGKPCLVCALTITMNTLAGRATELELDHVYLAPESSYESFYVGRVMQFLRPSDEPIASNDSEPSAPAKRPRPSRPLDSSGIAHQATPASLCAAIAWYQRPTDLPNGRVRNQDPRLLVATMQSDVNPISTIRGKCVVTHYDYVPAVLQYYQRAWQAKATFGTEPATVLSPTTPTAPTHPPRRRGQRMPRSEPSPTITAFPGQHPTGKNGLSFASPDEALALYTSLPDHFYYSQLFDRFVGRLYDVIPCPKVLNVPDNIAAALRERYQYILVEPAKSAQFTDSHRSCQVCKQWCDPAESMCCEVCGHNYHMHCLDPPLVTKPGKGYAWQCVNCLKNISNRNALGDANGNRRRTRNTGDPGPTANGQPAKRESTHPQAQPATAESAKNAGDRNYGTDGIITKPGDNAFGTNVDNLPPPWPPLATNLWPFRYLGIYAKLNDIIDYDERIYPRAASRIGPKYQAVVPPLAAPLASPSPGPSSRSHSPSHPPHSPTDSGPSDLADAGRVNAALDTKSSTPRSTSATAKRTRRWSRRTTTALPDASPYDVTDPDHNLYFCQPDWLTDADLDQYVEQCRAAAPSTLKASMEVMDRALKSLHEHQYSVTSALAYFTHHYSTAKGLGVATWAPAEQEIFEDQISKTGADLPALHEAIGQATKSYRDVVRHFYTWKGTKHGREVYDQYVADNFKPNWKGVLWSQGERAQTTVLSSDNGHYLGSPPRAPKSHSTEPVHGLATKSSIWTSISDPEATEENIRDEGWIIDPIASAYVKPTASSKDQALTPRKPTKRDTDADSAGNRVSRYACLNCGSTQAERWKTVQPSTLSSLRVYHHAQTSFMASSPTESRILAKLQAHVGQTLADGFAAHYPLQPPHVTLAGHRVGSHAQSANGTASGTLTVTTGPGLQPVGAATGTSAHFTTLTLSSGGRRGRPASRHLCDLCGFYWLKYYALPGIGEYERFLVNTNLFSPIFGKRADDFLQPFGLHYQDLGGQLLDPLALAPLLQFVSLYLIPSQLMFNPQEFGNAGALSDASPAVGRAMSRTGSRGPSRPSTPIGLAGFGMDTGATPGSDGLRGKRTRRPGRSFPTTPSGGGDGTSGHPPKRSRLAKVHPVTPCLVCCHPSTDDPSLHTCCDCGVTVHARCYGVTLPASGDSLTTDASATRRAGTVDKPRHHPVWRCDACHNVNQPHIAIDYTCILCRRGPQWVDRDGTPVFEALKPTISNNWVHMWCALGISEMAFDDRDTYRPIEGIQSLGYFQWTHPCELCWAALDSSDPLGRPAKLDATSPPSAKCTSSKAAQPLPLHSDGEPTAAGESRRRSLRSPALKRKGLDSPTKSAGGGPKRPLDESNCSVAVRCRAAGCRKYVHMSCAIQSCLPTPFARLETLTKAAPSLDMPSGAAGYRVGFEAVTQDKATRPTPYHAPPVPIKPGLNTTPSAGKRAKLATATVVTTPELDGPASYGAPTGASTAEIHDIYAFYEQHGHLNPVVYCPAHNKDRVKNFIALSAWDKNHNPILPAFIRLSKLSVVSSKGALLKSRLVAEQLAKFPVYHLHPSPAHSEASSPHTALQDPLLVPPSLALALQTQATKGSSGPVPQKLVKSLAHSEYLWPAGSIPNPPSPRASPLPDYACTRCATRDSPLWWTQHDLDGFNRLVRRYHVLRQAREPSSDAMQVDDRPEPEPAAASAPVLDPLHAPFPSVGKASTCTKALDEALHHLAQDSTLTKPQAMHRLVRLFTDIQARVTEQVLDSASPSLGPSMTEPSVSVPLADSDMGQMAKGSASPPAPAALELTSEPAPMGTEVTNMPALRDGLYCQQCFGQALLALQGDR
ncbi:putative PHD type zinc finger protein with BAH domain-containing protein [Dimargaris verticillata]|uniref:PHD type zinc finger protein with BAH domain-containing protein n=1 Tax=Dimargaris verticillata TaxID=2761393 RepID=A0A9W8B9G3_9FUNG|nr:putative PHD type zinc finger protein with BAH domain-containing protein [Dimargaris verticillata]